MIDRFSGTYSFLSNFYEHPVTYKGKTFASVEHAFQAYKADNDIDFEIVADQPTPGKAKRAGRKIPLRSDWEEVKLDLMLSLVRAKFVEDTVMLKLLQSTGDEELVEGNTWGDVVWGVCDGVGENHLGKILMRVRSELQGAVGIS